MADILSPGAGEELAFIRKVIRDSRQAAAWWFASIAFFFWSGPHSLALFALLVLILHLVPGIVLQRRWRGQGIADPGPLQDP